MDSWVWIPAFGFLRLDSWAWLPGFGILDWSPGLGFLDLDSWPEPIVKPVKTYALETRIANHEVRLTEPGPETHFFLIALHKLARALQITLPP